MSHGDAVVGDELLPPRGADPGPVSSLENEDVERPDREPGIAASKAYPWLVVGLLWFCGFFNYADRQAVNSVFPLLERSSRSPIPSLACWARRS